MANEVSGIKILILLIQIVTSFCMGFYLFIKQTKLKKKLGDLKKFIS